MYCTAAEEPIQNWGGGGLFTFSGHICMEKLQSYGVTLKIGGLQPPSPPFPLPMVLYVCESYAPYCC